MSVLPSGRKVNLDEEYDPSHPNNYDLVKAYYEDVAEKAQPVAPVLLEQTEMDV